MEYFMFVKDATVMSKGYGVTPPVGAIVISPEQFDLDINLATFNALPTYSEDGSVLTDADLTLLPID